MDRLERATTGPLHVMDGVQDDASCDGRLDSAVRLLIQFAEEGKKFEVALAAAAYCSLASNKEVRGGSITCTYSAMLIYR